MKSSKKRRQFNRSLVLAPMVLFAAALVFRLIYLHQFQSMPTFDFPVMDENYHLELVRLINSPFGMPREPFFRAPLYPYFLAMVFKVTGDSIYWSRLIQVVIGSLLPVAVLFLARKILAKKPAFIAAAITVFYPTLVYYDTLFLITSLMVLLTTILAWQIYRCAEKPTLPAFISAGILLGLAGLARPNILLFGPALLIWIWFILKPRIGLKKAAVYYVVIGLASLAVVLPVTVRNYTVGDDTVFIAWQGGFNFFLGNNRAAGGWSAVAPGIDVTWKGGYDQAIRMAEMDRARPLKRSEVSDYWYGRAWEEIKADPGRYVSLLVKKVRLMINGFEFPNNQNIYQVRSFAPIIKPLMIPSGVYFPYGVLAPLALVGIVLSLRDWRKHLALYLLVGAYAASLLLFFVCARFRQPIIPILIIFAVGGVHQIIGLIRKRRWIPVVVVFVAAAILMVESNHRLIGTSLDQLDANGHFIFGKIYQEQGRPVQAAAEYQKALKADPNNTFVLNNLGILYKKQGMIDKAVACFKQALTVDPANHNAYLNYANILMDRKDFQTAAGLLEQAAKAMPYSEPVHFQLSRAYYGLNRIDDAIRELETCLSINPQNAQALQTLDMLEKQSGETP